ncbi:MAG: NADH-quinone oxidoreductase subunit NuoE [Legionellaceae bacterium]|nr:NADH-quinone oxidoreductase subunit NuoE [Legionellaceae bacterium]
MSESSAKLLTQYLTAGRIKAIDHWIAKYPADQKQSAVMSALIIVQEQHQHLTTELMDAVAEYLDMPPIAVYEVASFYSMYEHKPHGRHLLNVCTNISCKLRGSDALLSYLENKLAIKVGQTTGDGRYTLRTVECLGACVGAPMIQVDRDFHENLDQKTIDDVLEKYV